MFRANDNIYLNFESLHGFEQIPLVEDYEKKEKLSDLDIAALRCWALDFFDKNGFVKNWKDFDDRNSICDSELYLNNFDGVYFDENLRFRTVFLTVEEIPVLSVHDEEKDAYTYYMMK